MKKGFTLIELLVVVLIIGILASVALPQYKKAVYKSRYATLKSLARSIVNAEEIYYLANGAYTSDLEVLSIDFPAGGISLGTNAKQYAWGRCYVGLNNSTGEQLVACLNKQINMQIQIYMNNSPFLPGGMLCVVRSADYANPIQNEVCKSETGKTTFYTQKENSYRTYRY